MRFYNREKELAELEKLKIQSETDGGKLAVITGRRRVGKTLLVKEFCKKSPFFYFFIEKKPEVLLCDDFLQLLQGKLSFPLVGEIKSFKDLFLILLEHSKKEPITVVIDEFQEFYTINPSVYSEIQNLWDAYKKESKMLLIVIGSVYSLMHKIFEDKKEPLFGRADRTLKLSAFAIPILTKVLKEHQITGTQNIFDFYVLTGSVPKYLDILMTNQIRSKDEILNFMLSEFSPFLDEGKNFLIEEFGKEYSTYFAILELISIGKTSRQEIESILGKTIGGFLERLEENYHLIYRIMPISEKPASRLIKFAIKDQFLNFWFRFIYKNRSAIELKNFSYVHRIISRDYSTYCGKLLERFFIELMAEQQKYNKIGTYWESKNLNEIDIVAVNDLDKKLFIAEVKLNPKKCNLKELERKAENLIRDYRDYQVEFACLTLSDAEKIL